MVGLDSAKMRHAAFFSVHALISLIGRDEVAKIVSVVDPVVVDSMLTDSDKLSELSLKDAFEVYDEGTLYGGQFPVEKDMSIGKFESKIKIYTHLISQLCISDPRLLAPYFDIFATGVASFQAAINSPIGTSMLPNTPQESKLQSFTATFLVSIRVIVPAISSSHMTKAEVFNIVKNVDTLAFPLVECLLEICQADVHLPASSIMIENVKSFVRNRHDVFPSQAGLQDDSSVRDGIAYVDPSVMKFLMSIISGMDTESLISVVPFVVIACVGNESLLNQAFHRIVQARPPSLTKAGLLIALHRIKPEVFGFDQKVLVHAIGLCLDKKDEFTGDVLQEALNSLVQDDQLPEMIMRTAIIGYQTHSELKSYVLTTLVPSITKRSPACWEVTPKVWDGVIYVINKLCNHKDIHGVLKVLLGIPLIHLKGVIEGAPNSKSVIGAYFKSLPVDLYESVLCGEEMMDSKKGLQEKINFLQNL